MGLQLWRHVAYQLIMKNMLFKISCLGAKYHEKVLNSWIWIQKHVDMGPHVVLLLLFLNGGDRVTDGCEQKERPCRGRACEKLLL
jgi:hypothetical protein